MNEAMDWIVQTVNLPGFRVISFLLSIISVIVTVWVFSRTRAVLNAQERSILSNQIQYVSQQYFSLNELMLRNDKYLALAVETFGYSSAEEAQKVYFLYMWLNPLYFQYEAVKLGLMEPSFFQSDIVSFVKTFQGDWQEVIRALKRGEYPEEFISTLNRHISTGA